MGAVIRRQDLPGLVISTIIGVALTFFGIIKLKNAIESKSWPITAGTVTRSEVAGIGKFYPSVSYTYIVDSVVYNSDRISTMNFQTKNKSVAQEVIDKYPLDSELKVYYNSAKPSEAFLEPGINTGSIILLVFGLIILAIPVFSVTFMKFEPGKTEKP